MEHVFSKIEDNYIVGILNSGLGNKIFLLLQYYYIYKIIQKYNPGVKLYILNNRSYHEKEEGIKIFNLFEVFMILKNLIGLNLKKLKIILKNQSLNSHLLFQFQLLKTINYHYI